MSQTGSMWSDGRISIGQCDLVESWDNLSLSQKKNLNYRYQMGCECRVSKDPSLSMHTYLSFSHSSVGIRHVCRRNSCYRVALLICSSSFSSKIHSFSDAFSSLKNIHFLPSIHPLPLVQFRVMEELKDTSLLHVLHVNS